MKLNLLDIDIKSTLKYQFIFFVSALMHITFMLVFAFSGLYMLMLFNVLSVAFYITGGYISKSSTFEKHGLMWIILMYAEITFHAVLCTVHLGFESCFFLYAMVVLSVAAYILFLVCDKSIFSRIIIIFSAITIISFGGCVVFLSFFDPLVVLLFHTEVSSELISFMRIMNIFFNTGIILFFSILFIMEIQTLIRKLNDTNDQLAFIATHDALTGLYNRHSLRKLFDELEKDGDLFCVVMGDIDDFKKINDTYGHDCGDIVLKTVAGIVAKHIGERDIACRWGGEEFLIIMRGSREECFERISLVKAQINELNIDHESSRVHVTMTFGFADSDEEVQTEPSTCPHIDSLISMVDKRLYKGKTSGKNVIVV